MGDTHLINALSKKGTEKMTVHVRLSFEGFFVVDVRMWMLDLFQAMCGDCPLPLRTATPIRPGRYEFWGAPAKKNGVVNLRVRRVCEGLDGQELYSSQWTIVAYGSDEGRSWKNKIPDAEVVRVTDLSDREIPHQSK